jgi:lysozyme family protein
LTAFERALIYTGQNEGGFVNHPNDKGGPTNFGITVGTLRKWRKRPVSIADVKNLTKEEADQIYKAWYWDTMDLDQIESSSVAVCMYDIGVVRGVGVPPKYAQKICNVLDPRLQLVEDGHMGPKTIAGINAVDPSAFIKKFSKLAEAGFISIAKKPGQDKFLNGWVNRARRLLILA